MDQFHITRNTSLAHKNNLWKLTSIPFPSNSLTYIRISVSLNCGSFAGINCFCSIMLLFQLLLKSHQNRVRRLMDFPYPRCPFELTTFCANTDAYDTTTLFSSYTGDLNHRCVASKRFASTVLDTSFNWHSHPVLHESFICALLRTVRLGLLTLPMLVWLSVRGPTLRCLTEFQSAAGYA